MIILVLNIGSSSIKYSLFSQQDALCLIEQGDITGIGTTYATWSSADLSPPMTGQQLSTHKDALQGLRQHLAKQYTIDAVVHRIVHGGAKLTKPCHIDQHVLSQIKQTIPLAPLHNPIQVMGIEEAKHFFQNAEHIAVFDTSFHHTIPAHIHTYAVPKALCKSHALRKYGFHGISYEYVLGQAQKHFDKQDLNVIICHLGSGASVCAIRHGQSWDTSMGFTPCGGLIMGTRPGDMDPGLVTFIQKHGIAPNMDIDQYLNQTCGLQGLCGFSDMRAIEKAAQQGDTDCQLAIDAFCYRVQCYIGSYMASLPTLDALIFTGGIGENACNIRYQICHNLQHLGIVIDTQLNQSVSQSGHAVYDTRSTVPILVIQTNEALQMAQHAMDLLTSYNA